MYIKPNNENLLIRSVRKGYGSESSIWEVGAKYKQIEQDYKVVGWNGESATKSLVYLIYDHEMNLVVEIESGSQLTVTYFRKVEEIPKTENEVPK